MSGSGMRSSVRRGRRRLRPLAAGMVAATALAATTATTALTGAAPATAAEVTGAFVPIGPTRAADTREASCGCTRVDANTITVEITGRADVPDDAIAVAVIVTATPTATPGFVTAYSAGTSRPLASTLNTRSDRVVANSAIVELGAVGEIALFTSNAGDIVVDITGAFTAAGTSSAGRFVPLAARRLVDTRDAGPAAGPIGPGGELTIPMPTEAAGDAVALAVTVTSVGDETPGYLTSRPAGTTPNGTSFLNVNGSGQAVAATAILPVSTDGLTIGTLHRGHVIVDLLGWFTGPGAPDTDTGLFVPLPPQRLLDTRTTPPRAWPGGTVELPVSIPGAGSLVTNVTATYADRAGFVTAFPAGTPLPTVSTLNPAMHDHTVANLAITQVSARGLAYFARSGADVVVDVTGMFVGSPVAASSPALPNAPALSRVLMVGDSTLATLSLYTDALRAFVGFAPVVDTDNCRRLVRRGCLSPVTGRIPNTIFEAVIGAPGTYDMVVVRAGYNDWNSDFPSEFDAVVQAARSKGAHTIIWMSYTAEWAESPNALRAYHENNADLFRLVTLPQYTDVVLADLDAYTRTALPSWTWDGAHLTEYGTWLITDYIARFVAAIEHRPCPQPWGPGGAVLTPCPKPEVIGAVPDVMSLY
jgi:hypothetical protein